MSEPRDNCQCAIVPIGQGVTIEFCPMHEAAPDLLEALKDAHDTLSTAIRHSVDESIMPDVGEHVTIKKIRAAIAKAESTPPGRADQIPHPTQPTEANDK